MTSSDMPSWAIAGPATGCSFSRTPPLPCGRTSTQTAAFSRSTTFRSRRSTPASYRTACGQCPEASTSTSSSATLCTCAWPSPAMASTGPPAHPARPSSRTVRVASRGIRVESASSETTPATPAGCCPTFRAVCGTSCCSSTTDSELWVQASSKPTRRTYWRRASSTRCSGARAFCPARRASLSTCCMRWVGISLDLIFMFIHIDPVWPDPASDEQSLCRFMGQLESCVRLSRRFSRLPLQLLGHFVLQKLHNIVTREKFLLLFVFPNSILSNWYHSARYTPQKVLNTLKPRRKKSSKRYKLPGP